MDTKQLIIIGAMFAGLLALKWALGAGDRGRSRKGYGGSSARSRLCHRRCLLVPSEKTWALGRAKARDPLGEVAWVVWTECEGRWEAEI